MRMDRGPITRRLRALAAILSAIPLVLASIPHAGCANGAASKAHARTAVLHWIGEYPADDGGGWHWSRCPLNAADKPTGEPVAHRLLVNPDNPQDPSPLTPIDIATTSHGDVVISHVQGNGAVRVFVNGDPTRWYDVSLGIDEVPFGVATHPTRRIGYVVTRSGGATAPDPKSKIWSFTTAGLPARVKNIATWSYGGELTGLDFSKGAFYVALSQWKDGSLVGRVRTGRNGAKFDVVARHQASAGPGADDRPAPYAVAVDPDRKLIHFAIAGRCALFTVRQRTDGQGPASIDVSGDAAGSVRTSAETSQISRTAARDRVVWAQFDQDNTSATAGIYHALIRGPKDDAVPTRILDAFRPRAAVIHVPRHLRPGAVDDAD